MAYQNLLLDRDQAVLKITVNRPEVLNAQSRIMREELDIALAEAAEDESVRVVIIAGAGKHFSAGHDLGSPQELEDRQRRPYAPGMSGQFKRSWDQNLANTLRWRDFPKPTIAQVQGYCIMGGLISRHVMRPDCRRRQRPVLRPHRPLGRPPRPVFQPALGDWSEEGQGVPVHGGLDRRRRGGTHGTDQPSRSRRQT